MGFEKRVLDVVTTVLKAPNKASFTCGTLFVKCSVKEAIEIESTLLECFDCGIILSRVGGESAYDFV